MENKNEIIKKNAKNLWGGSSGGCRCWSCFLELLIHFFQQTTGWLNRRPMVEPVHKDHACEVGRGFCLHRVTQRLSVTRDKVTSLHHEKRKITTNTRTAHVCTLRAPWHRSFIHVPSGCYTSAQCDPFLDGTEHASPAVLWTLLLGFGSVLGHGASNNSVVRGNPFGEKFRVCIHLSSLFRSDDNSFGWDTSKIFNVVVIDFSDLLSLSSVVLGQGDTRCMMLRAGCVGWWHILVGVHNEKGCRLLQDKIR